MAYIKINHDKVNAKVAKDLIDLCPFNAFDYINSYLSVNAACKLCKLCVKKGLEGACDFIENKQPPIDKTAYKGIGVYIEHRLGQAHPVSWELLGKAKELSKINNDFVYALIIGDDVDPLCEEAIAYGADRVYVYRHASLEPFNVEVHARVVEAFQKVVKANILLMGGTPQGRSFAPRIAAKLKTGLTADCTMLDMTEEGDLLQIRPAFGGNIMAKIHTPNHRPQLATIRYKMFNAPEKIRGHGEVIELSPKNLCLESSIRVIQTEEKPRVKDISDAEIIIAVGRAFKKQKDLELIEPLRAKLNAEVACTRPLIENGWFDPRKQIGLSGRTVKPKLLINLGISGAVQYIEGVKDAELIISVNQDPDNRLFDISHYAIVGDIYEVIPKLNSLIDTIRR